MAVKPLCKEELECREYIKRLYNEYIEKHIRDQERDELISENNIEQSDIRGYHGREILELLQNADDAYQKSIDMGEKPECDLEVHIRFKDNVLTVSNTGTHFDKNGIKAIIQGNNSPKTGKYIGNKGTGFRSILNWASKVRIYSGYFNVEFSEEIAEKLFREILSKKQIQKQISKYPMLYIPMLALPTNIEPKENNGMTTIEIEIVPEKSNDSFSVLNQIKNLDLRILLFLPNISKITIETEDTEIVYERKLLEREFKCLALKKYIDSEIQEQEDFFLFEKNIEAVIEEDNSKKDIGLAIAVPCSYETFQNGHLYSYFPLLNTASPFNCVMHATYILGNHRDTIIRDEKNKTIIRHQLEFLIETAKQFIEIGRHETAYQLLIPENFNENNWKMPLAFSEFQLEEEYLKQLEEIKMFPTVNGEYISVKNGPMMFDGDFPTIFKGAVFNKLLRPINHAKAILLIKALSERKKISTRITETYLLPIINKLSESWTITERVNVFAWWSSKYKDSLPKLLKTQTGKWLNYGDECYFLIGDFDNKRLPSWVKISSLDIEYQAMLFEEAANDPRIKKIRERDKATHISRLISQNEIYYPMVDFSYSDSNKIISTINRNVDSYNKSIDFVKWLWSNYKNKTDWTPPTGSEKSPIKYMFPNSATNQHQHSEKLYLGYEYGNELSEKLFDKTYGKFPSTDTFEVAKEEYKEFIKFIKNFGVKEYPLIEQQEVPISDNESYYKQSEKLIIANAYKEEPKTTLVLKFELPYIAELDKKLLTLTTEEIFRWINEDYKLKYCLSNKYYSADAKIKHKRKRQWYFQTYNGQISNYLLYVFNKTKWIRIGDKKYFPGQILLELHSRNNSKFSDLVPVLTIDYIHKLAKNLDIDYEKLCEIIEMFSFCNSVTDLCSEDFYGLMLRLPQYDFSKSAELSKIIYRTIEQTRSLKHTNLNTNDKTSINRKAFLERGKLLVQYHGELMYHPARESCLPSTQIINKKSVPIVKKGQRTNNENFELLFGCHKYEKDYQIVRSSISESKCNDDFQEYFREFIKYASAYSEKNTNLERSIRNLSVILADRIDIVQNGETITISDEYICLKDNSNWYITVFSTEYKINEISEVIETIFSNIAYTPDFDSGKLGELFRAKEKSDKEFLIKKDFDTLDVISDITYKSEIRNNFIETLLKFNNNYPVDKISIDFNDLSDEQNAEKLITLLSEIKCDVDEFKKRGFVYRIDLTSHYKRKLRDFIASEKKIFKNKLYAEALENTSLQKEFLKTVMRFENYQIEHYENSIYFDIEALVKGEFGDWKNAKTSLNSDEAYSLNYEKLNPKKLFEDEINNNINVQQMIYFNDADSFNEWLDARLKSRQKDSVKQIDTYSDYREKVPQPVEIHYRKPTNSSGTAHHIHTHSKGVYTHSAAEERNRKQKVFGNKGELLIYNLLCKEVGANNVTPRSEAFLDLGILKPGQAQSGEYDLSYTDKSGKERYVEVKSGDGKSFVITPGELEFAKRNADKYELYLVYELDSEVPKYTKLPENFWNDEKFRKKEIIERIEFEF